MPAPSVMPDRHRDVALVEPAIRAAVSAACRGETSWPLLFTGPAGTGKTRTALCLCDRAKPPPGRRDRPGAWYATAEELERLLEALRFGRLENSLGYRETDATFWGVVRVRPLAVLDEVGARDRASDANYAAVKRFLDEREGRPAVVISNLAPKQLHDVYDDRVASRLMAGTWLQFGGRDRRIAAARPNKGGRP